MNRSISRTIRLVTLLIPCVVAGCNSADPLSPLTTGGLVLTVSGLPSGTPANIILSGPGGYSRALTASGAVDGLAPGSYTLSAASVSSGGHAYAPATATQTVDVAASATRVP